jgi:DNA-binding SARP family transcriptional activator
MSVPFKVTLFGKFEVARGDEKLSGMQAHKVQELFCYLLLFRDHPQSRESLSELLWMNQPLAKSKKNLRQTLWRLQRALNHEYFNPADLELQAESDWIQINPSHSFWLDTAEFESTFNCVKEKQARLLSPVDFTAIQKAAALYKGDLLEGWYHDWCILERERFQTMHLMLLDKLVQYCEVHLEFDLGLAYGGEILRRDRAYERTHRQMMRLYYMAGDRTQAIHQYEHCKAALREELDVEPSQRTNELYEQMRLDTFRPPLFAVRKAIADMPEAVSTVNIILDRLERFSKILSETEFQVQREIVDLVSTLSGQE